MCHHARTRTDSGARSTRQLPSTVLQLDPPETSTHLDCGYLLLPRVISQLEALALCHNLQHFRVGGGDPSSEGVTADEDHRTREKTLKEVEDANGSDANEVEERPFHPEIGQWFVQTLVDPISPPNDGLCQHVLCTPEPAQDISGEHGNAGTGGNPSERLLGTGFAVSELVAADHDGNQAGYLCHRPGKQRLQRGKTAVERRPALGKGGHRNHE